MTTAFFILALVLMLMVFGSMVVGMVAMSKDSDKSRRNSNKMMQYRVVLQALALVFLLLAGLGK